MKKPKKGALTIDCDSSMKRDGSTASIAVINRYWKGSLICGFAKNIQASSVLQAEGKVIRYACVLGKTRNMKGMRFRTTRKFCYALQKMILLGTVHL